MTCDDFFAAMAAANPGKDIAALRAWYRQAGTPLLTLRTSYDAAAQTFSIAAQQVGSGLWVLCSGVWGLGSGSVLGPCRDTRFCSCPGQRVGGRACGGAAARALKPPVSSRLGRSPA